jgi:hypothetical protein
VTLIKQRGFNLVASRQRLSREVRNRDGEATTPIGSRDFSDLPAGCHLTL